MFALVTLFFVSRSLQVNKLNLMTILTKANLVINLSEKQEFHANKTLD